MRNWWSFSTAIIFVTLGISVATFLLLVPWSLLFGTQTINSFQWIMVVVGVGSPIWTWLTFLRLSQYSKKINENKIKDTKTINLEEIEYLECFNKKIKKLSYVSAKRIEYRLDGSIDNLQDHQCSVRSPKVLETISGQVVLIPATFLARFKNYPEELAAALLHEVGHIINKDSLFLFKFRTFLFALVLITSTYVVISLISSIWIDSQTFDPEAVYASIIGKSYYFSILGFLILLLFINNLLKIWREAMADRFSMEHSSEQALQKAEELLIHESIHQGLSRQNKLLRPQTKKQDNAFLMSPAWSLIAGIAIAILAYRMSGVFHYLSPFLLESWQANFLKEVSYFNVQVFFTIGLFYFLTVVVRNSHSDDYVHAAILHTLLLLTGTSIGYLLHELIPMAIPSLLMPAGYNYFFRAEPFILITSDWPNDLLNTSFIAILVISACLVTARSKYIWLGLLPGIIWISFSIIEINFTPGLTQGWLAISTTFFSMFLIWRMKSPIVLNWFSFHASTWMGLLILVLLPALYWLGYGGVNYFASVHSHAGLEYREAGEYPLAIKHYKKAVSHAPNDPLGWLQLAESQLIQKEFENAVLSVGKAVKSLNHVSSWSTRFDTLYNSTSLLLHIRREDDKDKLEAYFEQAELMWRNNSRLSKEHVVSLLYNLSCFHAVYNQDVTLSSLYLLEAVIYSEKTNIDLSKMISNDSDLAPLSINQQPALSQDELHAISSLRGNVDVPRLKLWLREGSLKPHTVLKLIKKLVHQSNPNDAI